MIFAFFICLIIACHCCMMSLLSTRILNHFGLTTITIPFVDPNVSCIYTCSPIMVTSYSSITCITVLLLIWLFAYYPGMSVDDYGME